MKDWVFKNDDATGHWLVFWIPVFLKESTGKSVSQQKEWLAGMRKTHDLPEHHCSSFGPGVLVAALILAHKERTGEEVPAQPNIVRTETLSSDGLRFCLRFSPEGLRGSGWGWDEGADSDVGCFLLGMEELGPLDAQPSTPVES